MNSLSDVYNAIAGTFDSTAIAPSATGTLIQNLKYIVNNILFASSSGNATLTNMDINIVTGGLEIATTTRISNTGQATLTTSTITSLSVSGTSTFSNLLTYNNATGTNLFGSSLVFATGTFTTATTTGLWFTNATGTNITLSGIASSTNAFHINATTTNLWFTNATGTSLFGSGLVFATGTFTTATTTGLWFTNATGTNITLSGIASSAKAFFLSATSTTFSFTNATGTNLFGSSLVFATGTFTTATTTGLWFTNATGTNITLSGIASSTNAFHINATTTNLWFTNATGTNLFGSSLVFATGTFTTATTTGLWFTNATGTSIYSTNAFHTLVSIGTTTMAAELTIQGTSTNPLLAIYTSSSVSTPLLYITSAGNIGIGTTTPAYDFVLGNGTAQKNMDIANGGLCVDNGAATGTNCPAAPVAGTIYASSTLVTGIDVAENYPTNDPTLEAGDLVAADLLASEHIVKAQSYGGRLIGVVSTAPGVTLGMSGADTRPVALKGRVPVKVSTENGEISIGDPITVSSVAGIGMKATLSGDIVGYALENFSDPTPGEIPVFINIGFFLAPGYQVEQSSTAAVASTDIVGSVTSFFTQIGATIQQGLLTLKNLVVGVLTAGKVVTDQIEMTDRLTGQIYCVVIENGDFVKTPGSCSAPLLSAPDQNVEANVGANTPTPTDVSTTTSPDASTTSTAATSTDVTVTPLANDATSTPSVSSDASSSTQ